MSNKFKDKYTVMMFDNDDLIDVNYIETIDKAKLWALDCLKNKSIFYSLDPTFRIELTTGCATYLRGNVIVNTIE